MMKAKIIFKGGPGSGHHGHRGMPGKHGGSLPGGGSGSGGKTSAASDSKGKAKVKPQASNSVVRLTKDTAATLSEDVNKWTGERKNIGVEALDEVANKGTRGFALQENGKAVAVASYVVRDNDVVLSRLATGKGGYGRQAMAEMARVSAQEGKPLTLFATPEAAGFYRTLGMKEFSGEIFEWSVKDASSFAAISKEIGEPENGVFVAKRAGNRKK